MRRGDGTGVGLVGPGGGQHGRLVDARGVDLGADDLELCRVGIGARAVDDPIGRAQDAEQRPTAAAILRGAFDEPRDLDELQQDAADPGQRRDRPERRERVVPGLDLDLGECLEQRGLADVGRSDERDLCGTLAADRDRVAVDGTRPDARVLDLGEQ